ncbi:MAG: phosphoenolpyruvate carboxylase [Chloroflexota bacterium]
MTTPTLPAEDTSALSADIKLLGNTLGTIIREQHGDDALALVERVRKLAKERRAGDDTAHNDLIALIDSLNDAELRVLVKAFGNYFQLINIAEDLQRVRVLRNRERGGTLSESLDDALADLKSKGMTAEQLHDLLNDTEARLVLTAHPSESKRQEVLLKLRQLAVLIRDHDRTDLLPREEAEMQHALAERIEEMWHTRPVRATKATVADEVNFGLYFITTVIMDAVVDIYNDLLGLLEHHYPDYHWRDIPSPIKFASWVGGDRDGNPNVTADVTLQTLATLHEAARQVYLHDVGELRSVLTQSADELDINGGAPVFATQEIALAASKYPGEIYRQQMELVYRRLKANEYHHSEALLADLLPVAESLEKHGGQRAAHGRLGRLVMKVKLFGMNLVPLEVREDASRHTHALDELFRTYGLAYDYPNMPEEEKQLLLTRELRNERPLFPEEPDFSPITNEVIATWRMIATAHRHYGVHCIDTVIASMSKEPSDVLTMLLLAREVGIDEHMHIVPLFETVDDLINAPATMQTLFDNREYRHHLTQRGDIQQIMLGYSDSNKDGGYLAANWNLYKAQASLTAPCEAAGVTMELFHGRGGSIGRGGGPTNRAIMAAPPGSLKGRIKMTEQGEVIGFRYSNPEITQRHFNQLLHAVLIASANLGNGPIPTEWTDLMEQLAATGRTAYRDLVYESDGFLDYWQQTTPISELGKLQISSRPAKRSKGGFAAMRAIPWVFSWMQARAIIPSWYGVGTALNSVSKDPATLEMLQAMYERWRFFRALMKNLQLDLVKADMGIVAHYATLADPEVVPFFQRIQAEHTLASAQVAVISQQQYLLESAPVLHTSIERRNPYVDPLNFIQVRLLRELREEEPDSPAYNEKLRTVLATINGVAAGMKTTG